MQSQIGQATQGPTSNPINAAIGKEGGNRSSGKERDHDTFQSILAEASEPAKKQQAGETGALVTDASAETESDRVPDEEAANTADDDGVGTDEDTALAALSDEVDEIVFKQKRTVSALKASDVVQLVAQAAKAIEAGRDAGKTSQPLEPGTAAVHRAETGTPPWFSTPKVAIPAGQTAGTTPAQTINTETAMASTPADQAGRSRAIATDEIELRTQQAAKTQAATENPGQVAKQEIKGAEKIALPMQQVIKSDEEPKHVIERRLASEESAPTFATQRKPAAATAGTQAFAVPLQTATQVKAQGASGEERGVRWMSEAGLTSEIAVQDMPATSRVQQTALLQQPDLPRNIAAQIAQAMRQGGGDRPMELVLSPAELGRVRISMLAGDGAMTVHVMADRPETLDLMRRHIDILAQEFHDIGYGTAEFAFGQSTADGGAQRDGDGGTSDLSTQSSHDDAEGIAETTDPTQLTLHSDRVDIRL